MVRLTLMVAAMVLVPGLAAAQAVDFNSLPAKVRQQLVELNTIQAALANVRRQATQEPEAQAAQAELDLAIRDAMIEADEENQRLLDQARSLAAELQAAQAAGDQARVGALGQQIVPLARALEASRQAVGNQPRIQALSGDYEALVEQVMHDVEPRLEELRERETELRVAVEPILGDVLSQ